MLADRGAATRMNFAPDLAGRAAEFLSTTFRGTRIARVLLVYLPNAHAELFDVSTASRKRYSNYPPYGLGILVTRLAAVSVEGRIANLNHAMLKAARECSPEAFQFDEVWKHHLEREIADFQPDLVGISCTFTMAHGILKSVAAHCASRGLPVALGGVHVSNDA